MDKVLNFIVMKFSHHSQFSGYHRFLDFIPNKEFAPLSFHALFSEKQKSDLIEKSLRTWYHYGTNDINTEIDINFYTPLIRKHIFHFIYGENTFCYSSKYNRRNKIFVASYHWPETWFRKQGKERFDTLTEKMAELDAVITVSSDSADFLRQYNPNVFCVHHGIDVDFFTPGNFEERDPQLCLFVGNWLRDFETLKKISTILSERDPKIQLEIVTPERNRHHFEGMGISVFSGISDQELREKYQKASVLLQPLIDCTANNSALEAMACGLPIIVTDVGGIRDYISENHGVFCEPGNAEQMADAAIQLLDAPEQRKEMGKVAREKAERLFAWPVVSKQMIDIYNKLG